MLPNHPRRKCSSFWGCGGRKRIVELYKLLERIQPSPMVRLNSAIAIMYAEGNRVALKQMVAIDGQDRQRLRPWWDGALATVHLRLGNYREAAAHYQDAMSLTGNPVLKRFFAEKAVMAERAGN
jgi:RNA polymerase sigma-70 factor, ECF subfamily